jgi:hypothetical protein
VRTALIRCAITAGLIDVLPFAAIAEEPFLRANSINRLQVETESTFVPLATGFRKQCTPWSP